MEWLLTEGPPVSAETLGKVLMDASRAIEIMDKRHVGALRVVIESTLKAQEQQIRAAHAAEAPGGPALSRAEILSRRQPVLTAEQQAALGQFALLKPLLEEVKLIVPAPGPVEAKAAAQPAKSVSTAAFRRQQDALFKAVTDGDLAAAKRLLAAWEKGVPAGRQADPLTLMRQSRSDMTVLMMAANTGQTDMIALLLHAVKDKEALVQMKTNDGTTALIGAAIGGHPAIVSQLLNAVKDKDALVQMKSDDGATALMGAAIGGHSAVVTQLLNTVKDKDALAHMRNGIGATALMRAAAQGHTAIVSQLLDAAKNKEALVQMRANDGRTALMVAAGHGHAKIVTQLLSAVQNKNALMQIVNHRGRTAQMLAAAHGHTAIVTALKELVSTDDPI